MTRNSVFFIMLHVNKIVKVGGKRMIGIIGAMDIEVEGIKLVIDDAKERVISGITFVSGTIEGREVVVAKCGIGKVNAAICTEAMIIAYSPSLIINTGVAGSLTPELNIGDIVIADKVCQHDFDTTPVGDMRGLIAEVNLINIPADEKSYEHLAKCVEKCGINYRIGTIASGDVFVADSETKDFIVSEFSASACEMEGASIGQVCWLNHVPFTVLRALSDSANEDSHMDYPEFCRLAARNSIRVIDEFLRTYNE